MIFVYQRCFLELDATGVLTVKKLFTYAAFSLQEFPLILLLKAFHFSALLYWNRAQSISSPALKVRLKEVQEESDLEKLMHLFLIDLEKWVDPLMP